MEELNDKLTELETIIKNSFLFKELENEKQKIMKNNKILSIKKQLDETVNIYDSNYQKLKKEYLLDKDVQKYLRLENEIYILVLKINQKLKALVNNTD